MSTRRDRCAPPPDGARPITLLEVADAIPVYLTSYEFRRLGELIDEIVNRHCNQPVDGIHWTSGSGSRPNFSAVDAAMLGVAPAPEATRPEDGGEPTFDEGVFQFQTTVWSFLMICEWIKMLACCARETGETR